MLRSSSYTSYRSRYGQGSSSSMADAPNAKIFRSSSSAGALWTSPLIPPALVGPFFGRGATNLKQLKSAFPALYIDFQKHTDPELTDHFRFSLSRNSRNVLRWSPADDKQLEECRELILACLHCARYAFHNRLTHALPVDPSAAPADKVTVTWKPLGDSFVAMAAELDVPGPLYVLADASASGGGGQADLNELSELLETLDIGTGRTGKLHHVQAYTDADLTALATRIGQTYDDLTRVYTDAGDRVFTLSGTLGAQVFGQDSIHGQLQLALPTDTTSGLPFTLADLEQAIQEKDVKPSFSEVFPPRGMGRLVDAAKGLGYTIPCTPWGAATVGDKGTDAVVETVAVEFQLDQEYLDEQLHQASLPGYTPWYQYKVTFVYDPQQDRFMLSEKGLRQRSHRLVRHTWVDLVSATTPPDQVHAVMPRLKFGVTRPNDRPRGWDVANDLLADMATYITTNQAALRASGADAAPQLLPLPTSLAQPLAAFRLRHKRVTCLASPHAASDFHVSVKHVTMWYRYNDPTGQVPREEMRARKWEVPERQPAFATMLLVDRRLGDAEQEAVDQAGTGGLAVGRKLVEQQVVKFGKELDRLAQAVRKAVLV